MSPVFNVVHLLQAIFLYFRILLLCSIFTIIIIFVISINFILFSTIFFFAHIDLKEWSLEIYLYALSSGPKLSLLSIISYTLKRLDNICPFTFTPSSCSTIPFTIPSPLPLLLHVRRCQIRRTLFPDHVPKVFFSYLFLLACVYCVCFSFPENSCLLPYKPH